MTFSPFDTIREALVDKGPLESWVDRDEAALAALTEVEQRIQRLKTDRDICLDRAVAAETALADEATGRRMAEDERESLRTALAEANQRYETACRLRDPFVGKYEQAKAALEAAERRANALGNQLAQERSKPEGTFDQWARLQQAEERADALADALRKVAACTSWFDDPVWIARAALDRQAQR